jgi:alcohol dehydrogenase class IV
MRFEFATSTRIIFGPGTLKEIVALAQPFGGSALVVTGANMDRSEALMTLLYEAGLGAVPLSVAGEPDLDTITEGVAHSKESYCDFVIAYGGGSVLDAGKAIAAMLKNDGDVLDYLEVIGKGKALTKPSAPLIAIPTTAGTGSEVTRNAVLASPKHRVKASLRSPLMLPRIALVDPELTYQLPPALTASTGLDALTQLIEPYVSSRANPMTDGLCVEGIRRVARSLRKAFNDGANAPEAREDMSLAGTFGGLALANAGLGAAHGFAGPIGGMFPAPHGAICAVLLPPVMAANIRALRSREPAAQSLRRYDEIAVLLTGNPSAKADEGVEWVRKLVTEFQIPKLGKYGVKVEHVNEIVEKAMRASSMKANPLPLERDELAKILQEGI